MSNGEDPAGAPENGEPVPAADFEDRIDEAADALDAAETEADLDEVEATLDAIEADLESVTLDDEDESDSREDLEDSLDDLSDDVDDQRGPYLEDVTDALSTAQGTIESSKWTEEGDAAVGEALEEFFATATATLSDSFSLDIAGAAGHAEELAAATDAIDGTGLDPDADAEEITTLLGATETLSAALDDAQVFGDLEKREQLRRDGFYDVLTPENRQDFPPEWNAVKLYEAEGEVEPLLTAFEKLDSDFMESNVMDALEHIAPPAAFEAMHSLAQRRNPHPVRILGRIGDERACDTLEDFLGGGDVDLEKQSLRALGCIGSDESTEAVAQRLAADDPGIRSAAARALGLIGDTRAIEPLADVLAGDEPEQVRASAAWALSQIGTRQALDTLADFEDDQSYLVQVEAAKAVGH